MAQRQTIVMLIGITIILLQMSLAFGKLWGDPGPIKYVKHPPCKPVPGVEGRMLRSLPKPTNSDSCPANGIKNVGPGNCEIKKGEIKEDEIKKESNVKIFVTDILTKNKIWVADLQDELHFTSIPATRTPSYITYDSVDKKIYWSDPFQEEVYRADVDGGNREVVADYSSLGNAGIAIAEATRTLYTGSARSGKITSLPIGKDSTLPGIETFFVFTDNDQTHSLKVDEEQRYLYWTTQNGRVHRKSLKGDTHQLISHKFESVGYLEGLSFAPINGGKQGIFLCDWYKDKTFYIEVNADGDVTHEIGLEPGGELYDVAYFNGVVYWTLRSSPSSIAVMNNYQYDNRSVEIKQISVKKPAHLLITTLDP